MNRNSNESKNQNENDFVAKCIHDIRNFKKLSNKTIEELNNLAHTDRLKILQTYNEVVDYANKLFEE